MMADEDDMGMFECGRWEWHSDEDVLTFVHDFYTPKIFEVSNTKVPTGPIHFRDDIDLLEQQRYKRMYQRRVKPGEANVVTLQDVKDLAIYTAPAKLLNKRIINILHVPTMDRFLRALILYCQYYLQVTETMDRRTAELATKVRTHIADDIEAEFCTNLADLRILVAKEYAVSLLGQNDTKPFHHKGPQKKMRSLTHADALLHETLIRMCVHIIWLALGRMSLNLIELEVNRLLRSETYNTAEHNLKTGYMASMSKEQQMTLWGSCKRNEKNLTCRSPLMNELYCKRPFDYRMLGLGTIQYQELSPRLRYMKLAISEPEENLLENNVTVGILGMSRNLFDVMLYLIPPPPARQSGSVGGRSSSKVSSSRPFVQSSANVDRKLGLKKLMKDVLLPPISNSDNAYYPETCRVASEPGLKIKGYCDATQRLVWLKRLSTMMHQRRRPSK